MKFLSGPPLRQAAGMVGAVLELSDLTGYCWVVRYGCQVIGRSCASGDRRESAAEPDGVYDAKGLGGTIASGAGGRGPSAEGGRTVL
jgi:hypothetical protein